MPQRLASEQLEKARKLIDEGMEEFNRAEQIEEEFESRRKASIACEKAFHAFVEFSNVLLSGDPGGHTPRIKALRDMGRDDLARFYRFVKDALHTDCFYNQQVGAGQREAIMETKEVIKRELEKLA